MIKDGVNLYDAQTKIKDTIIERHGEQWYENNGYAVQYIIENAYADKERTRLPYFDKEDIKNMMDPTTMW